MKSSPEFRKKIFFCFFVFFAFDKPEKLCYWYTMRGTESFSSVLCGCVPEKELIYQLKKV